jgi:hypothetical protein
VSARAETLQRIDSALAELGYLDARLTAARRGQLPGIDRGDVARRFHAVAHAGAGHHAFTPVQELAALAEKVTDGTDQGILHTAGEIEVVQHAADVLSLLLRDMGCQLLGRRGADVTPAATALRERLEHMLLATRR